MHQLNQEYIILIVYSWLNIAQKNKYVETAINIKTIKSENIGEALANEDVLLLGVVLPKIRLHQAK